MTIVPLSVYFNNRGMKLQIGIAEEKLMIEQDIKTKDWQRSKARILRSKNK